MQRMGVAAAAGAARRPRASRLDLCCSVVQRRQHSGVATLDYYTAWFCPFAHRATLALEHHSPYIAYLRLRSMSLHLIWTRRRSQSHDRQTSTASRRANPAKHTHTHTHTHTLCRGRYRWIEALGWSKKDEEEVDANSGEVLSHSWWCLFHSMGQCVLPLIVQSLDKGAHQDHLCVIIAVVSLS